MHLLEKQYNLEYFLKQFAPTITMREMMYQRTNCIAFNGTILQRLSL